MKRIPTAVALALLVAASVASCKKKDEPSPVPAATTPPPVAVAVPAAKPAATVTVTSVDLGSAVGPDQKVTAPATKFKKNDTIYATVVTQVSDAAATVAGTLAARWTYGDGQTVNEESRQFNFTGPGATEFHVSKPDGWPSGKYRVDVSLDGKLAASKDFEVE